MKRLVNRPAAGSAVVFTCDDETYQHLTLAIRRSGRVKGTEVQLRVDDHLRKFPDFYDVQKIYCAEEKREKRLFLRFDEQTNKMLIKQKTEVDARNRSKFTFALKRICWNFLIFIALKSK